MKLTVSGSCDNCGFHFLLNISGMQGETDTQEDMKKEEEEAAREQSHEVME